MPFDDWTKPLAEQVDETIDELLTRFSREGLIRLGELVHCDAPSIAFKASSWLYERKYGKAVQTIEVRDADAQRARDAALDALTDQELERLRSLASN